MIVPASDKNKTVINQWLKNKMIFWCRANCMNGHRASCILRDRSGIDGTNRAFLNHRHRRRPGGYKTLQKPRVQPEKR
ncbi:hypothetical protein [Pseudomonas sp. P9(2020)]|uniref:hypothetical protein n=1 Tax=Pseudomonas sp. P9(2020) TaxID=2763316 RepID=UPI001B3201DC|nr:hypothetical protein [Pseudomonas sp. P9(2020)]MBP5944528.1 hypothetical protein [Pseudomonas sp. P9(2020)]